MKTQPRVRLNNFVHCECTVWLRCDAAVRGRLCRQISLTSELSAERGSTVVVVFSGALNGRADGATGGFDMTTLVACADDCGSGVLNVRASDGGPTTDGLDAGGGDADRTTAAGAYVLLGAKPTAPAPISAVLRGAASRDAGAVTGRRCCCLVIIVVQEQSECASVSCLYHRRRQRGGRDHGRC